MKTSRLLCGLLALIPAVLLCAPVGAAPVGAAPVGAAPVAAAPKPAGDAYLRIAQTTAGTEPVDLVIDGRARLFNIPAGALSAYLPVTPGRRSLVVRPTDPAHAAETITVDIQLDPASRATVLPLRGGSDPVTLLVDDRLPAASAGEGHVRFIHLSQTLAGLTIDGLGLQGSPVPVGQFTSTVFVPVTAGPLTVGVRTAPGTSPLLSTSGPTIEPGEVVTMLISDGPQGTTVRSLVERTATAPTAATPASPRRPTAAATPASAAAATGHGTTLRSDTSTSAGPTQLALVDDGRTGGSGHHFLRDLLRASSLVGVGLAAQAARLRRRRIGRSVSSTRVPT